MPPFPFWLAVPPSGCPLAFSNIDKMLAYLAAAGYPPWEYHLVTRHARASKIPYVSMSPPMGKLVWTFHSPTCLLMRIFHARLQTDADLDADLY